MGHQGQRRYGSGLRIPTDQFSWGGQRTSRAQLYHFALKAKTWRGAGVREDWGMEARNSFLKVSAGHYPCPRERPSREDTCK